MHHLLRFSIAYGVAALIVLVFAMTSAGNTEALLGPVHLLGILIVAGIYLLPTGLAMYRGARGLPWIATLNIFFGWTLLGWFVALGWAAGASVEVRVGAEPRRRVTVAKHS